MENLYSEPTTSIGGPQTKLYSTPLGGIPQPIPAYWKFEDGTVRTDLQDLSDSELAELGWIGPIQIPIPKKEIFKSDLNEDQIEYYELFRDQYDYNEEDGCWCGKVWDYDPTVSKAVWSVKKREYLFLGLDEDEFLVNNPPPVLWDKFKMSLFKSQKFNKYVLDLSIAYPVISTSLSIETKNLNQGFHPEFINIWEYAKECCPLPEDVILELTELCNSCNLKEEDFNFLIK